MLSVVMVLFEPSPSAQSLDLTGGGAAVRTLCRVRKANQEGVVVAVCTSSSRCSSRLSFDRDCATCAAHKCHNHCSLLTMARNHASLRTFAMTQKCCCKADQVHLCTAIDSRDLDTTGCRYIPRICRLTCSRRLSFSRRSEDPS